MSAAITMNGLSNGVSTGLINGVTNGLTNGVSNGLTNGVSNGLTNGLCHPEATDDEEDDVDVELVVQGREITVSEKLLMKHSLYFRQLFGQLDSDEDTVVLKHGKLDGEEDISEEKQAEPLTMISYATMSTIVDFFNTKELKVGEQNVKHLLHASDLLAIGSVETACFNFLKTNLSTKNCIRRLVLADAKRSWWKLSRYISRFIETHFDQLIKLTAIYQRLSVEQFRRVIASPNLNVRYEEQVYDAVMDWVLYDSATRQRDMHILLKEVQWPCIMTRKYLDDAINDPFVMTDDRCADILNSAVEYHDMSQEEQVEYWSTRPKPSRWPKLIAALSYAEKMIECYDFEEERWYLLTEKPGCVYGAEMCYLNGRVYTIGGVQSKTVDQYDVEKNEWVSHFPSLRKFRVAHGVLVHDNRIYVTGGSAKASAGFGPGLNEMEMLQFGEDRRCPKPSQDWKLTGAMEVGRSFLGIAADHKQGKLYVVGGCLSDPSTAEMYDMKTNSWSNIASTLSKRDSLGLTMLEGEVFAVGGYNDLDCKYLKTVEKYDPKSNSWTKVKSMHMARRSPGLINYRGKLYVIGGMGEVEDLNSVEVFDPTTGVWTKFKHPLSEICGWMTCTLVDKPVRLMKPRKPEDVKPNHHCNMIFTGGGGFHDDDDDEPQHMTNFEKKQAQNNYDYMSAENERTKLRMKKCKELSFD